MQPLRGELTVGQLAQAAGVKASTVRYYERLALLPPAHRAPNRYRMFPAQAVRRILLIRTAQRLGFPLGQLMRFLRVRDQGGAPCRSVHDAGQQILRELGGQIAELQARRRRMRRTLKEWEQILATTPHNQPAHLLERFTDTAKR